MPLRRRRLSGGLVLVVVSLVAAACGGSAPGEPQGTAGDGASRAAPTVSLTSGGEQSINPTTPIVVQAVHGRLDEVTVTNTRSGVTVHGRFGEDKTTWATDEVLGYDSTYAVSATSSNADGKSEQQFTVRTLTPAHEVYPNMLPAPGAVQETGVGVGQPLVFQFSYPVQNKAEVQQHLKVTAGPQQEGAWYWIDDKNVHYRPKEFWKPGTEIHVSADIYGLDFGDGAYGETDREVTYRVHDSWVAEADGATQRMTILHNGRQVKTMPISMGKKDTPTHAGIHVVSFKKADYIMDSCTYGVCQGDPDYYRSHERWSARISNDGEFVHENPSSVGAQGNSNVSHGCINLNAANAQWFYEHFGLGDVVDVVNSGGPPLPVWDLYGDWSVPWPQWKAGNADT